MHDSARLQAEFERIVTSLSTTPGTKVHLDRRVPTRWNSDFACLRAHFWFREAIRILTGKRDLALEAYALTSSQWKLTEQLLEVLEVFDTITHQFSQAEVPLVYEVIPMLERLEHSMVKVREAYSEPAVIRIAAEAALTMIGKYYALTDDNEVYRIAIGKLWILISLSLAGMLIHQSYVSR